MDHAKNPTRPITSTIENFTGLEKDYNATSSRIVELSLETLQTNFSMNPVIDKGQILYQMEGINNSFNDVTEGNYINKNLINTTEFQNTISIHDGVGDNETTNSTLLSSCDDNDVQGWDIVFEFVFHGVLLNCVGMLGLVGNLLSIFILSRPQMKGSTNCILIGLATYDSILIITR